jgi:predicted DNA-binding transcriptional regulator AlpA
LGAFIREKTSAANRVNRLLVNESEARVGPRLQNDEAEMKSSLTTNDAVADDVLLRAGRVRRRYGASDMWLHRRLHDDSGFPRPIVIGRLRFWRLSELKAWEDSLAAKQAQQMEVA